MDKFFQILRKKQIVSLLKQVTMVLTCSKNSFRWLFIVILKQNVSRFKVYL